MTSVIVKPCCHIHANGSFSDGGKSTSASGTFAPRPDGPSCGATHQAQGSLRDRYEGDRDRGGRASRLATALFPRRQRGTRLRCAALGGRFVGSADKAIFQRAEVENTERPVDFDRRRLAT